MKRREFLFLLGGSALLGMGAVRCKEKSNRMTRWIWISSHCEWSGDDWKKHLDRLHKHGIDRLHLGVYTGNKAFFHNTLLTETPCDVLEQVLPLAKERGMHVHAWIWVLHNNSKQLIEAHPDWYVINRLGKSTVTDPPYVPDYRWLCPSKPQVQDYLLRTVRELGAYEDLAGIHLDYIRFPDVILPVGLQPKYHLTQTEELPQFDYCYCPTCRRQFKDKTGIDPLQLKQPAENHQWVQFREDQITNLVKVLAAEIRKYGKSPTAAVFPTPALARKLVRQNWSQWPLDAFFPMMYHGFYNEPIEWLGKATREDLQALPANEKLYPGLFIPHFSTPQELKTALELIRKAGAPGFSLFDYGLLMKNPEFWQVL